MSTTDMTVTPPGQVARKSPVATFRSLLDQMKPQIKLALPKHVDIDRMIRIVLTTVQRTPKLLDCTQESLLACVIQCAQLGLEPDGMLGHAYLIPYGNTATLVVGYKGLLKLARQSGEISSISARVVHEKDKFEYEYGLAERLVHVPSEDEDPGAMTHAYAIFRLKDGGLHFDVMSKREIDAIRKRSKASGSGPWVTDYEEMAKKTVLRRASKMSPASIDDRVARALEADSRSDAGEAPDLDVEMPAAEVPGSSEEQQGKRIKLGAKRDEAPKADPEDSLPVTEEMLKEIAVAAKSKSIHVDDAARWLGKTSAADLTRAEAKFALKRIAETPNP